MSHDILISVRMVSGLRLLTSRPQASPVCNTAEPEMTRAAVPTLARNCRRSRSHRMFLLVIAFPPLWGAVAAPFQVSDNVHVSAMIVGGWIAGSSPAMTLANVKGTRFNRMRRTPPASGAAGAPERPERRQIAYCASHLPDGPRATFGPPR